MFVPVEHEIEAAGAMSGIETFLNNRYPRLLEQGRNLFLASALVELARLDVQLDRFNLLLRALGVGDDVLPKPFIFIDETIVLVDVGIGFDEGRALVIDVGETVFKIDAGQAV